MDHFCTKGNCSKCGPVSCIYCHKHTRGKITGHFCHYGNCRVCGDRYGYCAMTDICNECHALGYTNNIFPSLMRDLQIDNLNNFTFQPEYCI